jgi:hypothetical protein
MALSSMDGHPGPAWAFPPPPAPGDRLGLALGLSWRPPLLPHADTPSLIPRGSILHRVSRRADIRIQRPQTTRAPAGCQYLALLCPGKGYFGGKGPRNTHGAFSHCSARSNNVRWPETLPNAEKHCSSGPNNAQSGRTMSTAATQCSSPKANVPGGFRLEKHHRGPKNRSMLLNSEARRHGPGEDPARLSGPLPKPRRRRIQGDGPWGRSLPWDRRPSSQAFFPSPPKTPP